MPEGAAPALPPLRTPTLSPARVSERRPRGRVRWGARWPWLLCTSARRRGWHRHRVTGTSGAAGVGHWDRLGTAWVLAGSPRGAAGTMCFQSPCPQPRRNPNHLWPLACNPSAPGYRINGSHVAPRCGLATAHHGTAGRDRQLPLHGANPGPVLPAAPRGSPCPCRVVSILPPGTPLARASPPKIAHSSGGCLWWPVAWCLAIGVPSQRRGVGVLSGP